MPENTYQVSNHSMEQEQKYVNQSSEISLDKQRTKNMRNVES
jgi:hypothetical protein